MQTYHHFYIEIQKMFKNNTNINSLKKNHLQKNFLRISFFLRYWKLCIGLSNQNTNILNNIYVHFVLKRSLRFKKNINSKPFTCFRNSLSRIACFFFQCLTFLRGIFTLNTWKQIKMHNKRILSFKKTALDWKT